MSVHIDQRWRVTGSSRVTLPVGARVVWNQMADLPWFLSQDPLHRGVRFLDQDTHTRSQEPGRMRGRSLVIPHRFFGVGPDRVGRVLVWRERTCVVSDLSRRGPRVGFPHVCSYDVVEIDDDSCVLHVGVRGLWTARLAPRWLAKLWIAWVLRATYAQEAKRAARSISPRCRSKAS